MPDPKPDAKPLALPALSTLSAVRPEHREAAELLFGAFEAADLVLVPRGQVEQAAQPSMQELALAIAEALPKPEPAPTPTPVATKFEYAVINMQQGQLWVDGAVEFRSSKPGAAGLADALGRLASAGFRHKSEIALGLVKQIIMERAVPE